MPHIHDKIDLTVEVFVVYRNTVLLRKHDKYKIWLSIGGHVELYEDPNQAAIREVKEEVGLDVKLVGNVPAFSESETYKELLPPRFLNRHRISEAHEHVSMIYFAATETNNITQGENEVSDEIHWFTREELDDPKYGIRDSIRHYAHKVLEEAGA